MDLKDLAITSTKVTAMASSRDVLVGVLAATAFLTAVTLGGVTVPIWAFFVPILGFMVIHGGANILASFLMKKAVQDGSFEEALTKATEQFQNSINSIVSGLEKDILVKQEEYKEH